MHHVGLWRAVSCYRPPVTTTITPAMRRALRFLSLDYRTRRAEFPTYAPNATMQQRLVDAGLAAWIDSGAPHLTDAGRTVLDTP